MTDHAAERHVLAQAGSDLSKPAHTLHYFYFKSMDAVTRAAAELQAAGYRLTRAEKAPPASFWQRIVGPRQYVCIAETHAVPAEAQVFATTDWMNALAAKTGGEYDGWEASVEK